MSARRAAVVAVVLYPTWLGMMAVHEFGHALHGWLSGAQVDHVSLPPLGFSQTFFAHNPHPHFVAWGGPVWGALLPLAAWAIFHPMRWRGRDLLGFVAGFCLIANGAYIGIGWISMTGDAGDLVDYGTPVWVMVLFGAVCSMAGLYIWHRLTRKSNRDAGVAPTT